MPVAAIDHLIERLRAGAASFPALTFDAEVIGDAFLVDVTELDPGRVARRPAGRPAGGRAVAKSWPVFMTFTRGRQQDQKPLFTVSALVFDNGVLDRLTVETGLVTRHRRPAVPGNAQGARLPEILGKSSAIQPLSDVCRACRLLSSGSATTFGWPTIRR